MFRLVSRLIQQRHPIRNWCSHGSSLADKRATSFQNVLSFVQSDRYTVFNRDSPEWYQIDEETKKLITFDPPKVKETVSWDREQLNSSNDHLIYRFESLLNHCSANGISLSETEFNEFVDDFIERLPAFNLNQLILALQIFAKSSIEPKIVRQPNYIELFHAFDQACTIKSVDLLPKHLLFISSIWLKIPNAKLTFFTRLMNRLFNRYMKNMTAPEVVQAVHYLNSMSQRFEDIRAFENVFENIIDDLTLEEFSSILQTFVRLNTKLEKQEMRDKFFDYLSKQDLNPLSDGSLVRILIVASKLTVPSEYITRQVKDIMRNLKKTTPHRSVRTCILAASVGCPIRIFDDELVLELLQRCINEPKEMEQLLMADLEHLSRILTMSNVDNDEMVTNVGVLVLEEVKNRLESVASRKFFSHFINIIRNLTFIDVYDVDLMENMFSPEYIECMYKKNKQLDKQMYEIDGFNRINLKGIYKGRPLPDEYLVKLCFKIEWAPDRVERYHKSDEFQYAIEDAAKNLFKYCKFAHALPHHNHADLFVGIDKTNLAPVDLSANFPPLYQGKIIEPSSLTKSDPNIVMFAFIAGNAKEFSKGKHDKSIDVPIGYLSQKITQLKLLGFHPIVIPIFEWREQRQESSRRDIDELMVIEINKYFQSIGVNGEFTIPARIDETG